MNLKEWIEQNPLSPNMSWNSLARDQVYFIQNRIAPMCRDDAEVEVNYTHRSKSITLPVYQISIGTFVRLTLRDNFYNWKISVESLVGDISANFSDLFDKDLVINSCYCEGFPFDLVFGSYNQNKSKFTIELSNDYKVYVFVWILTRFLDIKTKWS